MPRPQHYWGSTELKITVRPADYEADLAAIRFIRIAVFVEEQSVPAGLEFDDRELHCQHLLAFADGAAVGTARIDLEKAGKIGRLAVLREFRGHGVGRDLMLACHALAADAGLDGVWCHAQVSARPFYERLGYRVEGDVFIEAGIEHLEMRLEL